MKNKLTSIIGTVLIIFTAVSCTNFSDNNSATNSGKGIISVSVADSNARTVYATLATLSEMSYELKGTIENGTEETIKSWESYSNFIEENSIEVDAGEWSFSLVASKNSNALYSAETSATVTASEVLSLSFALKEIPNADLLTGNGTLRLILKLSSDVLSTVKAGVFALDWTEVLPMETLEIIGKNVTYEKELSSGNYYVDFEFYDEYGQEIGQGYRELIQIRKDSLSFATRTISGVEKYHKITYNLNGGILKNGITLQSTFNEFETVELMMDEDTVSKEGYYFCGWALNEDDKLPTSRILRNTKENVVLYAMWSKDYQRIFEIVDNSQCIKFTDFLESKGTEPISVKVIMNDKLFYLSAALKKCPDSRVNVYIDTNATTISKNEFANCTALTGITIPDSVTEIGENAFKGCTSLSRVKIPDSVTEIGQYAFSGCSGLTSITIPDSVTGIGKSAFQDCSSLAEVTILDGVTKIGGYAFENCKSLASIELPSSVTSIGEFAFRGCISLASIELQSSVASIGGYAFYGCTNLACIYTGLASIELPPPSGVTSIGNYAFSDCTSLVSIEIPLYVSSIGNYAFYGCTNLASIELPSGVTSIGNYAFSGCTSLASIDFPSDMTSIGDYAFEKCESLVSIVLPPNVTRIGESVFYECFRIELLDIPSNVSYIGKTAFGYCGLHYSDGYLSDGMTVYVRAEEPPSLDGNVFYYSRISTIYVKSVGKYRNNENWSAYKTYLKSM